MGQWYWNWQVDWVCWYSAWSGWFWRLHSSWSTMPMSKEEAAKASGLTPLGGAVPVPKCSRMWIWRTGHGLSKSRFITTTILSFLFGSFAMTMDWMDLPPTISSIFLYCFFNLIIHSIRLSFAFSIFVLFIWWVAFHILYILYLISNQNSNFSIFHFSFNLFSFPRLLDSTLNILLFWLHLILQHHRTGFS